MRYKYQGSDPNRWDNRALRRAAGTHLPLVWFLGSAPGRYTVLYPVYVRADEPEQLQVSLAIGREQLTFGEGLIDDLDTRKYIEQISRRRVHQRLFRQDVLRAYRERCAVCELRHIELLDAAHILADTHPKGLAVVSNGLAMCKIHHAAFDANIIGIRPDLFIEVAPRVLLEVDGPMLQHGIKEMGGRRLHTPTRSALQPNVDGLEERYLEFREKSA